MRRAIPIVLVLVAIVAAVALLATHAGSRPYQVRAIFDNAGFVIPGEDVKVAGVKVGRIVALDVTSDDKAAVVLQIDQPGYRDFRRDASCIVRPQSLIGERFVECTPTQPRAAGGNPPPALRKIEDGPGKGQYLLPVSNTQQSVDIDLIGDVMREPERERLSLILNELGTGLAGRGRDLNEVIRRANPALQQTDRVLSILASQNKVLEELAVNSDTVVAPLAREREKVAGAIRNSSDVAKATAERRGDLEADIKTLPAFLDELQPTMSQLGSLADQTTPVLSDLHDVAPQINGVVRRLGPFSQAAIPAFDSLGEAAKTGIPAVTDARPVIADLRSLAKAVRPVGATAAALLESFQKTQGIERLMDYIFYQVAAINGFDGLGHYLRAELIVNQCSNYSVRPVGGCSSNYPQDSASASSNPAVASVANAVGDDPTLRATALALAKALGQQVEKAKKQHAAKKQKAAKKPAKAKRPAARKKAKKPGAAATPTPAAGGGVTQSPTGPAATPPAPAAAAPAPTESATAAPTPTPTPAPQGTGDALLDYLFGGDGS
jgi:phospholipid/cholesterol/gamma-HCH transport system substrate-binding protein